MPIMAMATYITTSAVKSPTCTAIWPSSRAAMMLIPEARAVGV